MAFALELQMDGESKLNLPAPCKITKGFANPPTPPFSCASGKETICKRRKVRSLFLNRKGLGRERFRRPKHSANITSTLRTAYRSYDSSSRQLSFANTSLKLDGTCNARKVSLCIPDTPRCCPVAQIRGVCRRWPRSD